jgi:pSer/pThr/pTyr-binding forkhead associated (FHA) protein/S1-C subfamily serine protease
MGILPTPIISSRWSFRAFQVLGTFTVMPFLRLTDLRSGDTREFESAEIRIGRDPSLEVVCSGEGGEVVSALHSRLLFEGGGWYLEDAGSTNGTFLDQARLAPGEKQSLGAGSVIRLGTSGPRFKIEAAASSRLARTVPERDAIVEPDAPTSRMGATPDFVGAPNQGAAPAAPRQEPHVVLRVVDGVEEFTATGGRTKIGRGKECDFQLSGEGASSVSRVHAEIAFRPDGKAVLRDARSRNGTMVNGKLLRGEHEVAEGDHIRLGPSGPILIVDRAALPFAAEPSAVPADAKRPVVSPEPIPRRSFGGKGRTMFVREVIHDASSKSSARLRRVVWSLVTLMSAAVAVLYWYSEARTVAALEQQRLILEAQQAVADSLRSEASAEIDRLRQGFEEARDSSAPAAVVESLRVALTIAEERTEDLEAMLQRARVEMSRSLRAADSMRQSREAELARLEGELGDAAEGRQSQRFLDSLRRAVRDAEQRLTNINSQMRAVGGVNLAAVAQANQAAVGLVSTFVGDDVYDGTGFVMNASGYFVTNRHVIRPGGRAPDSVFVTLADQRAMRRAQVISAADTRGPDAAILRLPSYTGPFVQQVDWTGTRVRQGEPAALIGFPAGLSAALDETQTIRTSMSAGIFSKVTSEMIQYDGFTVGGSSGSPIFNAAGEVVAIHRAGLREAAGLGFAVPMALLIPLLPPRVRAEMGIR